MVTWTDMLGVEMSRRMDDIGRVFGVGILVHGGGRGTSPNVWVWSMHG
jgi:hypothetical protein